MPAQVGPVRPYNEDDLPEPPWWGIAPQLVDLERVRPSQHPEVDPHQLRRKLAGSPPESGDPHLAVVCYGGELYVHDGHHARRAALINGERVSTARVYHLHEVTSCPHADTV